MTGFNGITLSRSQGDAPRASHLPCQVRSETKGARNVSSTQIQPTNAHASRPVVTIVRDLPEDNGFWESQQSPKHSSRTSATAMSTQTGWDAWGSPLPNGGRSVSPSRRTPECDCKYNVKVLNEWRREIDRRMEANDRRMEANDDKCKAKLNILRAKIIEGEEERGKMKATIASLSKQLAANSASSAEVKLRASDPSYGEVIQNPCSTDAVNIPDKHGTIPEEMSSNMGLSREVPNRPNSATTAATREPPPSGNRPKSVQVSRLRDDPRASFDLPQNGELSFSWSEDPGGCFSYDRKIRLRIIRKKSQSRTIYGTRKMCFSKVPYIFRLETFSVSCGEDIKCFKSTFIRKITSDIVEE